MLAEHLKAQPVLHLTTGGAFERATILMWLVRNIRQSLLRNAKHPLDLSSDHCLALDTRRCGGGGRRSGLGLVDHLLLPCRSLSNLNTL